MLLFFCGNTHGRFEHIVNLTLAYRPAGVVLMSDLQAQRPLDIDLAEIIDKTEIYWIPGNHDTDSEQDYRNLFGSALADRNSHGRVVEIDRLRIAGLGGIFRCNIWMPPATPVHQSYAAYAATDLHGSRRLSKKDLCQLQAVPAVQADLQDLTLSGRKRKHKSSIFPNDYEALAVQQADILGAHPFGFSALDELAERMGVSRLFHGNHHERWRYSPRSFQAFSVGFCGVTDESGRTFLPGDFDHLPVRASHTDGGSRE